LAKELFEAYCLHKQTKSRMSEVIVRLFEGSNSFVQAKARIGYLEQLETWDESYNARLRSAVKSNSQIRDSIRVPERVTALMRKHE
jgi:hypothetical protein